MLYTEPVNIKLTIQLPFLLSQIKSGPQNTDHIKQEIQNPNSRTEIPSFAKHELPYDPFNLNTQTDPQECLDLYLKYLLKKQIIHPEYIQIQQIYPIEKDKTNQLIKIDKNGMILGRSNFSQFFQECSASGKHFQIQFQKDNFYIQDEGSKFGTFINIDSYTNNQKGLVLKEGQIIEFGKIDLVCEFQIQKLEISQFSAKIEFQQTFGFNKGKTHSLSIYRNVVYLIGRQPTENMKFKNGIILDDENSLEDEHALLKLIDDKLYLQSIHKRQTWLRLSKQSTKSELYPLYDLMEIKITPKVFQIQFEFSDNN